MFVFSALLISTAGSGVVVWGVSAVHRRIARRRRLRQLRTVGGWTS